MQNLNLLLNEFPSSRSASSSWLLNGSDIGFLQQEKNEHCKQWEHVETLQLSNWIVK